MMFEAQTPQGKVYWLDGLDYPLIGSPIVTLRLRLASETGLVGAWPAEPVAINLSIPGDVVYALEVLYGPDVTFSPDAPEPTDFFGPVEPGLIY